MCAHEDYLEWKRKWLEREYKQSLEPITRINRETYITQWKKPFTNFYRRIPKSRLNKSKEFYSGEKNLWKRLDKIGIKNVEGFNPFNLGFRWETRARQVCHHMPSLRLKYILRVLRRFPASQDN